MSKECRLVPFPYISAFVRLWMGLFSPCPLSAGSGFVFMWGGRVACIHVRPASSVSIFLSVSVILHVQLVLSLDLWPFLSEIPEHSGKGRRGRQRTKGEIERDRQPARKNKGKIKRRVSRKTDDKNRSRRDKQGQKELHKTKKHRTDQTGKNMTETAERLTERQKERQKIDRERKRQIERQKKDRKRQWKTGKLTKGVRKLRERNSEEYRNKEKNTREDKKDNVRKRDRQMEKRKIDRVKTVKRETEKERKKDGILGQTQDFKMFIFSPVSSRRPFRHLVVWN